MSIFYPPNQHYVFFLLFVVGFVLGMIYDLFRIKRRLFGFNKAVLFIDDFLYSLICLILILVAVFVTNNGIIRWYEFLMCFSGMFLYLCTLSKLVLFILLGISDLIRHLVIKLFGVVIFPLKIIYSFLLNSFRVSYVYLHYFKNKRIIYFTIFQLSPLRK